MDYKTANVLTNFSAAFSDYLSEFTINELIVGMVLAGKTTRQIAKSLQISEEQLVEGFDSELTGIPDLLTGAIAFKTTRDALTDKPFLNKNSEFVLRSLAGWGNKQEQQQENESLDEFFARLNSALPE